MTRFQKILLGVACLVHAPWLLIVYASMSDGEASVTAATFTLVLFAVSLWLFWGRARGMMHDAPRRPLTRALVELPYFVHLGALILAFVPMVFVSAAWALGWITERAGQITYGLAYTFAAYGVYVRRRWFVVRRYEVPIVGLPTEFDGFRVAHLSDLHIGGMLRGHEAERFTEATNREAPDLVVLTGDYVTSGVAFHQEIATLLGTLRAPSGVVASLGNHDYFGDGEPLISLLRAEGVTVLRNEGMMMERGAGRWYLAATDDVWTRRADVPKALAEWPREMPCVLLAHDPGLFPQAAEHGVALTLAGHTHGGQLAVPFLARYASLSHLAHRYHQGFYREGKGTLYVSPGLGTTGLPMRIGTEPTVAILTLRCAPAA